MRVLLGFQTLPAEPLNWNLMEQSDRAFRDAVVTVEIVNKLRDFEKTPTL